MIQQVTSAQVQQAGVQPLPVQQAATGETFESLMKSSADAVNKMFGAAGKTGSVKNAPENQDDTAQKTGTDQTSVMGINAFSAFALLGQNIGTFRQVFSDAKTAGGTQTGSNVNLISMAQDSGRAANLSQGTNVFGSTGSTQTANASGAAQTANVSQETGNVQTANNFTAQTTNLPQGAGNVQTENLPNDFVNAGFGLSSAAQFAQVSGQNIPDSGKTVNSADTGSNDSLQAFVSRIPGQPAQQDSSSIFSVSADQPDGVTSAFSAQDGTFRTTLQKSEAAPAEQKATSKNDQSDFAGKLQETAFLGKKSNLSDTETASQNQSYTDLLQNGNVIIPISANPKNTAKSACSQVTDKIEANYRAGKSEFAIDLYPKDLGKVSVKLGIQNGVLTVEISAANPKTQSMLLANTDEIKSILQSSVNQAVQVTQPQEKAWYEQSQNQSNQSSAQQQEQQRQDREDRLFYSTQDDGSTEDFLSAMRQLSSV